MMWITGALVVGAALLGAVAIVVGVRRSRTETLGDALVEADGEVVVEDRMANYFGLTSAHPWQLRGNGTLMLTTREIFFQRWTPAMVLRIPRGDITKVELVKAHLGKRVGRPLLKLTFRTEDGEDSVAWYVSDPDQWVRELPVATEVEAEVDLDTRQQQAAERARQAGKTTER